ncbi:uncharacterized protein LOC135500794 [Lineus longissimus]|uniref:uncharacterized protein LOC135500794 n=1 Tax=Lineus longissimus TaxID=88925 RepID=UPI00315DFFDC
MRADTFRYLVLDDIGGLYADIDYESLRPIDNFTSNHSCIVSQEPLEHAYLLYDKDRFCCNAIIAAAPGHQFFKWLIGELPKIAKSIPKNDVQRKTGPAMLDKAVQDYARIYLNGDVSKDRELYVAAQKELMPQFDIKQWYAFNAKCRQRSLYQGVKRRICEELQTLQYQNRPLADAFSNHHWVHFWGPDFENGYGQLVSIDDIAPYRVNVTDYVMKMPRRSDKT